jgi:Ser/Thr protein kinase RdoA (MazF antagonist)
MAVYTHLDRRHLAQLADDYALGKVQASYGVSAGSVNTHYRLDTAKGRYFLKIDEVKSEMEVKREIDLLLYLRKHGFPCPQLIVDRKGRQYRELGGKCLSLYKFIDGHSRTAGELTLGQIENAGRVLADLHDGNHEAWRDLPFYQKRLLPMPPEPLRWLGYQAYTRSTGRSPRKHA